MIKKVTEEIVHTFKKFTIILLSYIIFSCIRGVTTAFQKTTKKRESIA